MSEEKSLLNSNQVKAVHVLASGGSITEAAEAAEVTERTVYNWRLNDMAFRARLTEMTDAAYYDAGTLLSASYRDIITVMRQIANNPEVSDSVRISAGRALLATLPAIAQMREQQLIQERLEAIEAQLAQLGADNA